MAKVLSNALAGSGAMVIPVRLLPSLSDAEIIRVLTNADKFLLLSLYEWKSDAYSGPKSYTKSKWEAIDKQGRLLARKKAQGIDQLGAGSWDPQGHAQDAVPAAFQRKLEDLFRGEVAEALSKSD